MRKSICGVYALIVVIAMAIIPIKTSNVFAYVVDSNSLEEKVSCTATIEDDFSEERVLILMKNSESLKFKKYDADSFSEIGCVTVKDLSVATAKNIKEHKEHDCKIAAKAKGYHQILSLELKDKGKENVLKAIKKLEKRDDIYCAEPDYKISLNDKLGKDNENTSVQKAIIDTGDIVIPPLTPSEPDPVIPNDPFYTDGTQWAIDRIKLPQAWSLTTGSNDIVVGVIDSGIDYTHPDLVGKIDESKSYDFENNTSAMPKPSTLHWHGTFVAGIIGASTNNGKGISGACWNVKMASLRVLDQDCAGYDYNTAYAIDYAESKGIQILNISIGSYIYSQVKEQAVFNYSGLIICSAGNDNNNNDGEKRHYLSYYSDRNNVISVGASNRNDAKVFKATDKGSNFGKKYVSLFAPGDEIESTDLGGKYDIAWGTSFSAPYVTGTAVLLKVKYPSITPAEIKTAIIKGVDKVSGLSDLCASGGRLNAYRALVYASLEHSYTYQYQFISQTQHRAYCSCIHFYTESPHWAYSSSIYTKNGHKYAVCAVCKATINIDNNPIITISDKNSLAYLESMGFKVITDYNQLIGEITSPNVYRVNTVLENIDRAFFDKFMIVVGNNVENTADKIYEALINFENDIDSECNMVYNEYSNCTEVWL